MFNSEQPDPARLGGWQWLQRSNGRLTRRERLELLGRIAASESRQLAHRLQAAVKRRTPRTVDLEAKLRPPDSRFALEVEAAANEQTPGLLAHSYRTWIYGRALAEVDAAPLDDEIFYAGCLLHDHGLMSPTAMEDFTLRSAERALGFADDRRGEDRPQLVLRNNAQGLRMKIGCEVDQAINGDSLVVERRRLSWKRLRR